MNPYADEQRGRQLGVLAKYWLPGTVKTRLVPYCGPRHAAALHQLFLETTLRRFVSLADRQVLSFSPAQYRSSFAKMSENEWDLLPQQGGNLGERIANYFQEAFSKRQKRVLLIGADTPHLPRGRIKQAFDALKQHDLVFVVSEDGGYCLIGASRPVDPLMVDIEWGSSRVWKQTKKKIDELNWSVCQLPSWYDIDRQEDIARMLADLATHDFLDCNSEDPYLASLYDQTKKICERSPAV